MRRVLTAILLLAGANALRGQQDPAFDAPEVKTDRTVLFRLEAPAARRVLLWGEWMPAGSTVPLARGADGAWTAAVGPLAPGLYLYSFDVDGLRAADPANRRVKNGYPGLSSLVEIPGPEADFLSIRDVPHGTIHVERYVSAATSVQRRFHVYTPPGFVRSSSRSYPTAYLLHGSSDTDTDWLEPGRAGIILDNLLAAGKAVPMLLVMVDGHPFPSFDTKTRGRNLALLRDEIFDVVMPRLERDYGASPRPQDRALVGVSMGGAQALHLGMGALDKVGSLGLLSTPGDIPFEPPFEQMQAAALADVGRVNALRLFWMACGRDDPMLAEAKQISEALTHRKILHVWRETEGAHDWVTWRRYWAELASRLFRP